MPRFESSKVCRINVHSTFNTTVAATSLTVGVLLQFVAFFSMEWSSAKATKSSKALWTFTYEEHIFKYAEYEITSYHRATQILVITANVLAWITLGVCPVHTLEFVLFNPCSSKVHKMAAIVAIITSSGSGICSVVAMILWGAYIHDMDAYVFGPGFVTCLTSAFLIVLGGVEIHRATMSHQSISRGE